MANTSADPTRLATPASYRSRALPVFRKVALRSPLNMQASFSEALKYRRSAQRFGSLDDNDLGDWLYYCASVQNINAEDSNRQQRFVGSFGALHPAHILLGRPDGQWSAYLPSEHCLGLLEVELETAVAIRNRAMDFFDSSGATIVALLVDADLVASYYENATSLVLRDSGVLLGHGALVAAALKLPFRILGGTGSPFLERLIPSLPFKAIASGLALIGSKD